ncbi:hypothetical protein VTN00DRAFT_483 [Thermoascus crustaceus]|uniref:uncharacterized protein n=1 Tax=Thermoascus crustaceus TaxID=5088 RepID=UPI00374218FD
MPMLGPYSRRNRPERPTLDLSLLRRLQQPSSSSASLSPSPSAETMKEMKGLIATASKGCVYPGTGGAPGQQAWYWDIEDAPREMPNGDENFDADVTWLAVAIVRGCTCTVHLAQILETIHFSGILGPLDFDAVDRKVERGAIEIPDSFAPDVNDDEKKDAVMAGTGRRNFFGFRLPSGIGSDGSKWEGIIRSKVGRFDDEVERVFKRYFGVPDEVLTTVDQEKQED